MNIFWTYFQLEWKKSVRVLGKSLLGLLLLVFVLAAGVAAISVFFLRSQAFTKVQVAVVIPEKETLVKQAADFASALESVESICQLHYLSEEEAWKGLKTGEIQAVIQIPDNFYEDVYRGVNTPAVLYLPEEAELNTRIFCELLSRAVSMLQHSEAGVYAALAVEKKQEAKMDRPVMGDFLAKEYALEILRRDKIFKETIMSATGELELKEYYLITALLLILLFMGLLFGFLYKEQNRAVEDKLAMYGLGRKKVALVKIFTMTAILWMAALGIYLLLWGSFQCIGWQWLEIRWQVLPGVGLLCLALGAWFHLLFSLGGKSMQSTVMVLGVNLFMVLCCGLLLPAAYLPQSAEKLGDLLPLHGWSEYLQKLIFTGGSMKQGFPVLAGAVILTGLGAVAYEKIR